MASLARSAFSGLAAGSVRAASARPGARVAVRAQAPARVFTDAEWEAAVETASATLATLRASTPESAAEEVSAAATVPADRVFSDEEWAAAIEEASKMLTAYRAVAGDDSAASPDVASASSSAAVTYAPAPEGRVFSDEEWAAAIEEASKMLAASRAIAAAIDGNAADGSAPAAPAPAGRIFSDAEWDAALTAALAAKADGAEGVEGVSMVTNRVFTDAEWDAAIAGENLNQFADGEDAAAPVPVSFGDAMAIAGPVPETANGRVAMVGFVAAVAAELSSGAPVSAQFSSATPGVLIFLAAFSIASVIPVLAGKTDEELGPFTPAVEALNGRAAMVGLAALILIENATGAALF